MSDRISDPKKFVTDSVTNSVTDFSLWFGY